MTSEEKNEIGTEKHYCTVCRKIAHPPWSVENGVAFFDLCEACWTVWLNSPEALYVRAPRRFDDFVRRVQAEERNKS